MTVKKVRITPTLSIGGDSSPLFIIGPCVIESESMLLEHADSLAQIANRLQINLVFKASYDKANRTSFSSFRGPGLQEGLRLLQMVKDQFELPLLTDVHSIEEAKVAAEVVDIIQIPAFLCRQTDLVTAAALTGKTVNVKKGQFLAPEDVLHIIEKITSTGCENIILTERGTSFGYHRLIVDYAGIVKMREFGFPVIFDATHSVQSPGGANGKSGGEGRLAPFLAYAAAAVGIDGLFIETHKNPNQALSDGANMIPLSQLEEVLKRFIALSAI